MSLTTHLQLVQRLWIWQFYISIALTVWPRNTQRTLMKDIRNTLTNLVSFTKFLHQFDRHQFKGRPHMSRSVHFMVFLGKYNFITQIFCNYLRQYSITREFGTVSDKTRSHSHNLHHLQINSKAQNTAWCSHIGTDCLYYSANVL